MLQFHAIPVLTDELASLHLPQRRCLVSVVDFLYSVLVSSVGCTSKRNTNDKPQ